MRRKGHRWAALTVLAAVALAPALTKEDSAPTSASSPTQAVAAKRPPGGRQLVRRPVYRVVKTLREAARHGPPNPPADPVVTLTPCTQSLAEPSYEDVLRRIVEQQIAAIEDAFNYTAEEALEDLTEPDPQQPTAPIVNVAVTVGGFARDDLMDSTAIIDREVFPGLARTARECPGAVAGTAVKTVESILELRPEGE